MSRPKKKFKFINPHGEEVETIGLKALCDPNGLSISHMSDLANGRIKSHKGWTVDDTFVESKFVRDGDPCTMVLIPTDALLMAKRMAKKKNQSIESYLGDIIELFAGGYID